MWEEATGLDSAGWRCGALRPFGFHAGACRARILGMVTKQTRADELDMAVAVAEADVAALKGVADELGDANASSAKQERAAEALSAARDEHAALAAERASAGRFDLFCPGHNAPDQFFAVPPELLAVSRLIDCRLSSHKLLRLPLGFGKAFPALETLRLDNNATMTELCRDFANLGSLRLLDVQRTRLGALPYDISRLVSLQNFVGNDCDFGALPSGFGKLAGLTRCDLSNNRLTELPELENVPALTWLTVANNKVSLCCCHHRR